MLPALDDPRHVAHLQKHSYLGGESTSMLRGVTHVSSHKYPVPLFGHILGPRQFRIATSNSEALVLGDWAIVNTWQQERDRGVGFTIWEGAPNSTRGMPTSYWACDEEEFEKAIDELICEVAAGAHRTIDGTDPHQEISGEELPPAPAPIEAQIDRADRFVGDLLKVLKHFENGVVTKSEVALKFFDMANYYEPNRQYLERAVRDLPLPCRSELLQVISGIEERGPRECPFPYWEDGPDKEEVEREAKRHAQALEYCAELKGLLNEIAEKDAGGRRE